MKYILTSLFVLFFISCQTDNNDIWVSDCGYSITMKSNNEWSDAIFKGQTEHKGDKLFYKASCKIESEKNNEINISLYDFDFSKDSLFQSDKLDKDSYIEFGLPFNIRGTLDSSKTAFKANITKSISFSAFEECTFVLP